MSPFLERAAGWVSDPAGYAATALTQRMVRLVIGGAMLLLVMPDVIWGGTLPAGVWQPPPGPFTLLDAPPPVALLVGVQLALVGAAAAWTVSVRPRVAGWAVTLLGVAGLGVGYSFGKIDHTILLWLAPAVLEEVGARGTDEDRGLARQAFALVVAIGFLSTALFKARGGWLDPLTQATQGHQIAEYVGRGRTLLLARTATALPAPLWELVDVLTVLVEGHAIVTWMRARWFHVSLALFVAFHVGVALTLNIAFVANTLAYAAFVPWARLFPRFSRAADGVVARHRRPLLVGLAGVTAVTVTAGFGPPVVALATLLGMNPLAPLFLVVLGSPLVVLAAVVAARRPGRRPVAMVAADG